MRNSMSILALVVAAAAVAAGGLPWLAGLFVAVPPGAVWWLLGGAGAVGVVALATAAFRRPVHPATRVAALCCGLFAAASSPALLAIVMNEPPGEPRLIATAGSQDVPTTERFRVLQLDVDEAIVAAIDRFDPDLVFIRNAWCRVDEGCVVDRVAATLDLHAAYAPGRGSLRWLGFESGPAILSRFPIEATDSSTHNPRGPALVRGAALKATIAHPHFVFDVVATDPGTRQGESSGRAAGDLIAQVLVQPERPTLISGALDPLRFKDAGYVELDAESPSPLLLHAASSGWRPLWIEPAPGADALDAFDRVAPVLAEFQLPTPPPATDWPGDWQLVPAEAVGLDADRVSRAVEAIGALDGVRGLLVARGGRLVAEQYFAGASRDRLHNLKSASKSILSALAGLAIADGALELDQPLAGVLPEASNLDEPGKNLITVRHLLTMTSGLESTSFGAYGSWVASQNWVQAALDRRLEAEPGTRFSYSTGSTHLLSAMLRVATGTSTHQFARARLFTPLGIERSAWASDRQGVNVGGNNMSLTPRDMLKFGQLYLDRGRWGDEQVVPWRWVDESTRSALAGPRGRARIYGGYGYLWWLRPPRERGAYIASGYGGQYIYIAPAEEVVVVVISTEVSKGRQWRRDLFRIVRDDITGAVRDRYERAPPAAGPTPN